ncbi:MAG TPA: AMP-binding protein [Methylomirabilota bacterium]|nr:AMP-binding protein [Methylomirabilota bacterium]
MGSERGIVERQVLDVVGNLVAELGGPPARRPVGLSDSLERDLGIGSLERVELLLRLEQAVGVRLPDSAMSEAATPADLVAAVAVARPSAPEGIREPIAPLAAGIPAPASAATLLEVLDWHARLHPERVHIYLRGEDDREEPITYGQLQDEARAVATGLRAGGLARGDRVALMLRTEAGFFRAFFGILWAGGIPVPLYPPYRPDQIEDYAARQVRILRNAEARVLISFPQALRVAGLLRSRVPGLRGMVLVDQLARFGGKEVAPHTAAAEAALIQYTSGSTGAPKGVLLSHSNILANIQAVGQALDIRPDDVAVSWLPLYHDMGLIGCWLGSLYWGVPVVILSPLGFLSRPARWLWALHAHRGTVSAAPNFAFDLCVRKVAEDELRGLDLSSWRLAMNGSEPVSPETMERFTRRFARYGFRADAMCPVYGLAEASVALTVPPLGRPPRVDAVAREPFETRGEAWPAGAEEPAPLRFPSCGCPLPGHEVRLVDEAGRPVGERLQGRIEFRGPSVTGGYFRNPEANRHAFRDGWMDSGDLGYWAQGELFVTGRQKDIIIKAGRNLYPQEVEELVGAIPGVRKGRVAVFGLPDPAIGTERLVVVAESRETEPGGRERLRAAVLDRVVAALGLPPDTVVIAGPGSVLKTPSGKIRRSAMREAYLRGDIARGGASTRAQWARLILRAGASRIADGLRRVRELAYGVYVGALLLLTMPALWALVALAPSGRAADRTARLWCRLILDLAACPLRVEGLEHLRGTMPAVLVANHASYLDVVTLLAALPIDLRFVAKRELLRSPLVGTVIRRVGHLAVERVERTQSIADAERVTGALRDASILVFPEGTFLRPPGILPFRLGAFKAAVETGRPVIPISIQGTRDILPADSWLPRPRPITVAVGPPLKPEGTGWPEMVRLRDRARAEIAGRSGEPVVARF